MQTILKSWGDSGNMFNLDLKDWVMGLLVENTCPLTLVFPSWVEHHVVYLWAFLCPIYLLPLPHSPRRVWQRNDLIGKCGKKNQAWSSSAVHKEHLFYPAHPRAGLLKAMFFGGISG